MAADRRGYGERQSQLLRALVAGDELPEGFAPGEASVASRSLRLKRSRAVAKTWPALAFALGSRVDERFDAFARSTAPPAVGGALADGLAFASTLDPGELSEDARVEVLVARARLVHRGATLRRRRGPFLRVIALHEPRRLLVVAQIARGSTRVRTVPLGR